VQADLIEQRLAPTRPQIKAVCVVHNETSTGVTSDIAAVRRAIDAAGHPALLMVDTISGLASADYRHDEWGVDVTVSGSQKGLMLPPGISFNALSPKALEASRRGHAAAPFWAWDEIVEMNKTGYWPYTPSTNLLYGLSEALDMLLGQGLPPCLRATSAGLRRARAVRAWGLPIQCADERVHSPVLTGVVTPVGVDADAVRKLIYERFDLSLGTGLGKVKGRMFRIGHLGDCNDLTLAAALCGCEMGLKLAGVPSRQRRAGRDGLFCLASQPPELPTRSPPPNRAQTRPDPHDRRRPHATTFPPPGRRRRHRHPGRAAPARAEPAQRPDPHHRRLPAGRWHRRILARVVGQKLSRDVEEQVIIENKAGAWPACWRPNTWRSNPATAPRC
jgi:hypothetical protein